MSLESKKDPADIETDGFEDLPFSFEETRSTSYEKAQETEEVNPEKPIQQKKKSLKDHFSFPKAFGELLGGFVISMIGFAVGGSSSTNVLALLGMLSILKGIVTLVGSLIIYAFKDPTAQGHSHKENVSSKTVHNERKSKQYKKCKKQ